MLKLNDSRTFKKVCLHLTKGLTACVAILAIAGCGEDAEDDSSKKGSEPKALKVSVVQPLKKPVVIYSEFTGRLEAVEMVEVVPRVSGYIKSIDYREGRKVQKGDLLFVVDKRPFVAEVNRLKAQVSQAQAALSLASANQKRAQKLIEVNAISGEEVDIRESEANQAEADLQAAKAELEVAKLNLSFTDVTAPIDGIADRHLVTKGNLVTGDQTVLTTIVPHSPIYAYYDVDERSFLRGVRSYFDGELPGRDGVAEIPAFLGLDDEDGYPRKGKIDFASNQLDRETATITVRAIFENKDEFLTPGLFARIRVPASKEQERILIPEKAIGTDQTIKFVWVVGKNNKAERRPVKLGPLHEGKRIVTDGLSTSDRVVVSAIQFVRPDSTLEPEEVPIDEVGGKKG